MQIDAIFPNTSAPEGVRVVLALVGFIAAFWGLAHTADGLAAFATPIRGRMGRRRQWQMSCAMVMQAVLCVQALIVSTVPDVYPLSFQTFTGNLALIVVSGVLTFITLNQSLGWVDMEFILGKTPLVPAPDAYISETSLTGRDALHGMANDLQKVVGEVDILAVDVSLTTAQRAALTRMADHLTDAGRRMLDVQQILRALSPEIPPATLSESPDPEKGS